MIFWLSEPTLRQCVSPELLQKFDERKKYIFDEHVEPGQLPHSRLKLEGHFGRGWFRSMKSYYLTTPAENVKVVRAKGVTKTVQRNLEQEHFEVGEDRQFYFTNYALRPTQPHEMTLGVYTRKNTTCLNFKRRLEANRNNTRLLE